MIPDERSPLMHIDPVACRRLWVAVLVRFVDDAHRDPDTLRWLWSSDAEEVLHLAGFDVQAVRDRLRDGAPKLISRGRKPER